MEAEKSLAENHSKNIQLQKAVKEMEFVINVTQRLISDRLRADVSKSKHNKLEIEMVGREKTNQDKPKIANSKVTAMSNRESPNRVRTRSQSCSSSNSKSSMLIDVDVSVPQPISNESKVAKVGRTNLSIQRQTKDQALSTCVQKRSQIKTRSQCTKDEPNLKKFRQ